MVIAEIDPQRLILEQAVRSVDNNCSKVCDAITDKAHYYARELHAMVPDRTVRALFSPVFFQNEFSQLTPDILYYTFLGFCAPELGVEDPITEFEYLPIEQGPRLIQLTTRYAAQLDKFLETRNGLIMVQRGAHAELDRYVKEHGEGPVLLAPAATLVN